MKKSAFLIPAFVSLAFAGVTVAQEATPTPSPSPTATPASTPEKAASQKAAAHPTPASIPAPDWVKRPADTETTTASPTPDDALPPAVSDADLLPPPDATSSDVPPPPEPDLPVDQTSTDLPDPDSLIPPDATDAESIPPAQSSVAENKFQKDRQLEIRYQQVRLQALKNADVRNLHDQADAAKTDEGKRQALREYYRLLYAKMIAIDPALTEKCNALLNAYLRRIGQFRVAPSIPLNPPPTPDPLVVGEPAPTPKPKKPKTREN